MKQSIFVTGGAGYIGSHACVELLQSGYSVIVLDNLSNSSKISLEKVESITGQKIIFYEGDIRDNLLVSQIFERHNIMAVMHFAGSKSVAESMIDPLSYFDNNIGGTISLLSIMKKYSIFRFIFSSSATVYDSTNISPLSEEMPTAIPNNNYGYSKLVVENMLKGLSESGSCWSLGVLRYFNPIGAHYSGMIGENPLGVPNNLVPYITQTALGRQKTLKVYGNDYPTFDGTGIRDFIHVVDLARAHVSVLDYLLKNDVGYEVWNIGTGSGYSVLQVIEEFQRINNVTVNYEFAPRRAGDLAISFADNVKAARELGFKAEYGLDNMLVDAWRWQTHNPNGYQ